MATRRTAAPEPDPRDASLRVSKRLRDSLKAAAAVMGRPLYEITNEAIYEYLDKMKLTQELDRWRRSAAGIAAMGGSSAAAAPAAPAKKPAARKAKAKATA